MKGHIAETIDREAFDRLLASFDPIIADSVQSVLDMIEHATNPDEDTRQMLAEMMGEHDTLRKLLVDGEFPSLEPGPPFRIGRVDTSIAEPGPVLDRYDLLCVRGDCLSEGDLLVDEHKILLVKGRVSARNIRVYGHLFVDGDIDCRVLFGASGNDNMTHVSGAIRAETVAENGHYTRAERSIDAVRLICVHNEISAPRVEATGLRCDDRGSYRHSLNPAALDDEGYFDEARFLTLIDAEVYRLDRN